MKSTLLAVVFKAIAFEASNLKVLHVEPVLHRLQPYSERISKFTRVGKYLFFPYTSVCLSVTPICPKTVTLIDIECDGKVRAVNPLASSE